MDVKEIKNGKRYCLKLQIDEGIKYKWSISSKYKVNRVM